MANSTISPLPVEQHSYFIPSVNYITCVFICDLLTVLTFHPHVTQILHWRISVSTITYNVDLCVSCIMSDKCHDVLILRF